MLFIAVVAMVCCVLCVLGRGVHNHTGASPDGIGNMFSAFGVRTVSIRKTAGDSRPLLP